MDGMARIQVLAANAPPARDFMLDAAVQCFHPSPRGVMSRIERTGMKMIGIHGCVFSIQLLRDDDLLPTKVIDADQNLVVSIYSR